jgi:UDP-N-acetylmuramoylalanine-D-glutamate ligase
MSNASLTGKRFVVVGLGKSGVGAIELLVQRGATVLALDDNAQATLPQAWPSVTLQAGPFP